MRVEIAAGLTVLARRSSAISRSVCALVQTMTASYEAAAADLMEMMP